MTEVRNCLTCKWCTPWSDEDRHGNRWAHCDFPMDTIPSCITTYIRARLIDMQRDFNRIGFCESPRDYIGYITDCPTHTPKEQE